MISPTTMEGKSSLLLMWDTGTKFSAHTSSIEETWETRAAISHTQDDPSYVVGLKWNQNGRIKHLTGHRYVLELSRDSSRLELSASFSQHQTDALESQAVSEACQSYWPSFWQSGGIIGLSQSSDPRWFELERRTILAQYVMAVNGTGQYPPQESGLVNFGWYGKFHMEMNWWHTGYLALFNRWPLLDRSLSVYERFLPGARKLASSQGYDGARWPKMTDPSGRSAPGEINNLLIWQQPHPMIFAELDYRAHPNAQTLNKWKSVLSATADFMASYAIWNESSQTYGLGPPLHVMSENTDSQTTCNPAFELHYWRYGLSIVQILWERLGIEPKESWSHILINLAPPPTQDGLYTILPDIEDMWTKYNWEHPALVGMYGWLPGHGLDMTTMRATTQKIWETWRFDSAGGGTSACSQ